MENKKLHIYLSTKAGIWFARAEKHIARASAANLAAAALVEKLGYKLTYPDAPWTNIMGGGGGREVWQVDVHRPPHAGAQITQAWVDEAADINKAAASLPPLDPDNLPNGVFFVFFTGNKKPGGKDEN